MLEPAHRHGEGLLAQAQATLVEVWHVAQRQAAGRFGQGQSLVAKWPMLRVEFDHADVDLGLVVIAFGQHQPPGEGVHALQGGLVAMGDQRLPGRLGGRFLHQVEAEVRGRPVM